MSVDVHLMSADVATLRHAPADSQASEQPPVEETVDAQLVYLVRREGLSAVFASQVATKMVGLADAGMDVRVAVFAPVGQFARRHLRRQWQQTVDRIPASLRGRMVRLPSFPSRFDWPMAEAQLLKLWLRARYGRSNRPLILQCRNATVTRMGLAARRTLPQMKVVFDCRGVADHEFLYMRGADFETAPPDLKAQALRLQEEQRLAAVQSDAVFCVSQAMVDYLVREYGIPAEKCVVVPCCVDVDKGEAAIRQRDESRKRLGLEDRLVVAYCGSLGKWQCGRESLELFEQIRRIESRAHFLAVTTQPDAMRSVAAQVGVPADAMTVVSVPHEEVAAHLAAADVGLLLREPCPVNEVASPVKFGEYLASGTPVILSEGIGDYSELTRRENVGLVLPTRVDAGQVERVLRSFLAEYRAAPDEWRTRCRNVARQELDSSVHLPKVLTPAISCRHAVREGFKERFGVFVLETDHRQASDGPPVAGVQGQGPLVESDRCHVLMHLAMSRWALRLSRWRDRIARKVNYRMRKCRTPSVVQLYRRQSHNLGDVAIGTIAQDWFRERGVTVGWDHVDAEWAPAPGAGWIVGGGGILGERLLEAIRYQLRSDQVAILGVDAYGEAKGPFPACVNYASARSSVRCERLRELGCERPRFAPDIVWGAPAVRRGKWLLDDRLDVPRHRTLWVSATPWPRRLYYRILSGEACDSNDLDAGDRRVMRNYESALRGAIIAHVRDGWQVICIPFQLDDYFYSKSLLRGIPVTVRRFQRCPWKVLRQISRCQRGIATRFHSHVFSLLTRTPTISVAYGHHCEELWMDNGFDEASQICRSDLLEGHEKAFETMVHGSGVRLSRDEVVAFMDAVVDSFELAAQALGLEVVR